MSSDEGKSRSPSPVEVSVPSPPAANPAKKRARAIKRGVVKKLKFEDPIRKYICEFFDLISTSASAVALSPWKTLQTLELSIPRAESLDLRLDITRLLRCVRRALCESISPEMLWSDFLAQLDAVSSFTMLSPITPLKMVVEFCDSCLKDSGNAEMRASLSSTSTVLPREDTTTSSMTATIPEEDASTPCSMASMLLDDVEIPSTSSMRNPGDIYRKYSSISTKKGEETYTIRWPWDQRQYVVKLQVFPAKVKDIPTKNWWKHSLQTVVTPVDLKNPSRPHDRGLLQFIRNVDQHAQQVKKSQGATESWS